ncbi:MAG: hypothetical protein ACE5FW_01505 [Candidatus Aenigmatarchaeota archaeon]
MAIKWGEPLVKGLKFAVHPKRWLLFFIIDLVFLGSAAWIVLSNLSAFTSALVTITTDVTAVSSLLGYIAGVVVLLIVWGLLRIWAMGAIIHQSFKEKDAVKKSFSISFKKYPSLLLATIIIGVIAALVGWVPYIGWIISIVVGLIFFFVVQGIIVKGSGAFKAINESWKIFKGSPFKVFLMWLLIVIIGGAISLIFALPALGMVLGLMLSAGQTTGAAAMAAVLFSVMTTPVNFVAVFVIFLVGSAVSMCFSLKAITEYYLQVRKRFKVF